MQFLSAGKVCRHGSLRLCFAGPLILSVMKITISLLLLFSLGAYASGRAQSVTLTVKNMPLREVFSRMKAQTGYHFLYQEEALSHAAPVTLSIRETPLTAVLESILPERALYFRISGRNITVLKSTVVETSFRNIEVRGTVRDSGTVLQGVTVTVKGSKPVIGTATDANGRFILDVPNNAVLEFNFIGYIGQEIPVAGKSNIDVMLMPDTKGLGEVVVVGFGKQKKSSLVSSIATVKGEQLRMPTRSLSNNLAGQVPGLIAVQRSGEPGYDNAEFWIRGVSSFAGGTSPLVLVDGVPRNMNDIEPDEIETFTLLKDAAATAIYGAEGANGVILITSKRGTAQKTRITYRGEYSRLKPTRLPRFANSYDYLSLYNEALRNEGKDPAFSDEVLAKYKSGEDPDLYPSSNWWDLLMRDHTNNTRHTLNFRGGGDRMRFFVSGAYFSESGLYKVNQDYNNNAGLKRYNLRSNIDIDVTKTTLIRVDLSGQYLQTNYPGFGATNLFERFSRIPPHLFPAVYSDGTLAGHPTQNANKLNPYNQLVESGYQKEWRSAIQSRVDIEQKLDIITPGLRIRGAISYDANSQYRMTRIKSPSTFFAKSRDADGKLVFDQISNGTPFAEPIESNTGDKNIYMEAALNYDRTFGKHVVSAMALTYQKERQLHSDALAYRKQAYIGRTVYTFDSRYSIEANFGITGSENFSADNRYGFFPAIGLAWNVANEPFFPESLDRAVGSLKLRASIGRTGNDNLSSDRFGYRATFLNGTGYSWGIGTSGAVNGLGNGLVEGKFSAPMLGWEVEVKKNFGIDASLFNGAIDFQVDYFDNRRTDILLQRRTIPGIAGFRQAPWQNFGIVENKGLDGSLNLRYKLGEVLLSARGNLTIARNKIIEYDEVPQLHRWMDIKGTRLNALNNFLIAERLFTDEDFNITIGADGKKTYALKDGIAPTNYVAQVLPGDIKYRDMNGDGIIDDLDRVKDAAQPTVPEMIYGFGLSAEWKGFYASVFFQGAGRVSVNINDQANAFMPFHWGIDESNVRMEVVESRWTEQNPSQNVFFPRLRVSEMSNTNTASTWWVRDGSFIRLKNVEAGYNFNTKLIQRAKMRNARIYIMGNNVALWDHVGVYDPELGNSAGGTRYPIPSTWTAGIEITL